MNELVLPGEFGVLVMRVTQIVLGLIFAGAFVAKGRRPRRFVAAIRRYELLPPRVAPAVAIGILVVEALVAAAFLTGAFFAIGAVFASSALVAFMAAAASTFVRGFRIPCGCFGGDDKTISTLTLARLLGLLGAATVLLVINATSQGIVGETAAPLRLVATGHAVEAVSSGLLALLAIALLTWFVRGLELAKELWAPEQPTKASSPNAPSRAVARIASDHDAVASAPARIGGEREASHGA